MITFRASHKITIVFGGLIASLLSLSSNSDAALVVYTDRSAWQAAAGGIGDKFEDLNGIDVDAVYAPSAGAPTQVGFLGFSVVDGSGDETYRIDAPAAQFVSLPTVNGTTFAAAISHPKGNSQLTFSPVRGFGFDYGAEDYSTTNGVLTTSNGDFVAVEMFNSGNPRFIGLLYTAGESFTSLTWLRDSPNTINNYGVGIDNIEAMSSSPVPEPPMVHLLLGGLGIVSLVLARSRRAEVTRR
jgi:hypothetical protein